MVHHPFSRKNQSVINRPLTPLNENDGQNIINIRARRGGGDEALFLKCVAVNWAKNSVQSLKNWLDTYHSKQ